MAAGSRTQKLAAIIDASTLTQWLGETIQEKAGKENAGLVEITVEKNQFNKHTILKLKRGSVEHTITVTTGRV